MLKLSFLNKFTISAFYILGIIIFAYPSNSVLIFNGLPFDNIFEVLFFCIALPVLIFLKIWRFKITSKIFFIFLIIKIFSLFGPLENFKVKQFLVNEGNSSINVKSYDSIFNNGFSLISNGIKSYKEMPFSWMNIISPDGSLDIGKYYPPENYKINLKLEGLFNVEQQGVFIFDLSNVYEVNLKLVNDKGQTIFIFSKNETYEVILDKSNYLLKGNIISNSENTWFSIKNEKNKDIQIYHANHSNNSEIYSRTLQCLELLLIFFSFLITLINFYRQKLLIDLKSNMVEILNFVILIVLSNIYYQYGYFLENQLSIIFGKSFLIALYLFLFLIIATYKTSKLKKNYTNKELMYLVVIPIVLFFTQYYYENIFLTYFHSKGDDWTAFEKFSYQILILKEYLWAGEDFFYFRPLMRYIFSFFYLVFGQTFYPLQIFEIYGIIFCAFFVKFIGDFYGNSKYSLTLSLIFLIIIFGETFKINLGKGLTEYYSVSFLCMYIFFLLKYRHSKLIYVIPIFGAFGFWLREDHLPVTLICAMILINEYKFNDLKYKNLLKLNSVKKIIIINIILVIYFLMLGLRNYLVGGEFRISHFQVGKVQDFLEILKDNIYPLIAGNTIDQFPRTFSVIILGSIILSIYKILIFLYNHKNLKINYVFYPIILISSILPYFYVANNGYPPRYSIMILFFSFLVLASSKRKDFN